MSESEKDVKVAILEAARAGNQIGAIKMIRDHYGYNLMKARNYLEELKDEYKIDELNK